MVKAQLESDKLTAERELAIAQRETTNLQVELKHWKTLRMSDGQVSEIEPGKRVEAETKLEAAQAKCDLLLDKCEVSKSIYMEKNVYFLYVHSKI